MSMCPFEYYGNTETGLCEPCHPWCSRCYGPTESECTACKIEYKKIISQNSCVSPICVKDHYWDWITMDCEPCYESCSSCTIYGEYECDQCQEGWVRDEDWSCRKCEQYPGLYTNVVLVCEEICGDGILYPNSNVGHTCDDGNLIDGDGCDSSCQIEHGFTCNNSTCHDSHNPVHYIETVTSDN